MADLIDPRVKREDILCIKCYDSESFLVFDRHLLVGRPAFFSKTVKDESGYDIIKLPSKGFLSTDIVGTYLRYLPKGLLRMYEAYRAQGGMETYGQYYLLINAYLFGEHVGDSEFQNDVMDGLLARYRDGESDGKQWLPSDSQISQIYGNTLIGSPLRKFIVDIHVWARSVGPKGWRKHETFLNDLIAALLRRKDDTANEPHETASAPMQNGKTTKGKLVLNLRPSAGRIPRDVSCCDYHVHKKGDLCGNRKRKRAAEDVGGTEASE